MDTEQKQKTTRKIRRMFDLKVVADPPHWYYRLYSGERLVQVIEDWAKDFNDFMRDHRSQDPVELYVERDMRDCCSACGCEWEPWYDEKELGWFCAGCGAVVENDTNGNGAPTEDR